MDHSVFFKLSNIAAAEIETLNSEDRSVHDTLVEVFGEDANEDGVARCPGCGERHSMAGHLASEQGEFHVMRWMLVLGVPHEVWAGRDASTMMSVPLGGIEAVVGAAWAHGAACGVKAAAPDEPGKAS